MKTGYLILPLLVIAQICCGQADSMSSKGFYIPKNIEECNMALHVAMSKKAREKLKLIDDERDLRHVTELFITGEWLENDSTRLVDYFKRFSITGQDFLDREFLILLSYHRFINNRPFDIVLECKKITDKRDSIKQEREKQYNINITADSIDGIFIPPDLNSCFMELDCLLNDTIKQEIRSKQDALELAGEYHMGIGRWVRNHWCLWGGSRLQVYFRDRKIFHPDEMSSIILESYAKYLNGDTFDSDEIIQKIHDQHEEFMKNHKLKSTIKFTVPEIKNFYSKEYKRFLRTRKIKDFDRIYRIVKIL